MPEDGKLAAPTEKQIDFPRVCVCMCERVEVEGEQRREAERECA